MNVLDAIDDFMKHSFGLVFRDTFIFDDMIEEFSIFHVLHDQKKLFWCLNDLIKLHKIGVSDEFEDMDLASDSFDVRHFIDFLFLQKLDCYFLVGMFMNTETNFAECAFA